MPQFEPLPRAGQRIHGQIDALAGCQLIGFFGQVERLHRSTVERDDLRIRALELETERPGVGGVQEPQAHALTVAKLIRPVETCR